MAKQPENKVIRSFFTGMADVSVSFLGFVS